MKFFLSALLFCLSVSAYAQPKAAFSIAEITIVNNDIYQKELWPKIQKLVSDAGAEIVVHGGQGESLQGIAKMPDKVTIIKFKSMAQAKSFYASKAYQEVKPLAEKTVKIKLYLVEGD